MSDDPSNGGPAPSGEELLTIEQATSRFRVSAKTLRRRLARDEIAGAFKRPGPTGTEWALPAATLDELGYQRTAAGGSQSSSQSGAEASVADQRDAWRRRALEAEALAEEQAAVIDALGQEPPSAAVAPSMPSPTDGLPTPEPVAPAPPRPVPTVTRFEDRSRNSKVVVLVAFVAFVAFIAGIIFAGLGDDHASSSPAKASGTSIVVTTTVPALSTTAATTPSTTEPTTTTAPVVTTALTVTTAPTTSTTTPPTTVVTAKPAATPPTTTKPGATTAVVERGGSFWSVARDHVAAALGRAPTNAEIGTYWSSLIKANLDKLPQPGNPNLLYVGTTLTLPG